MSNAQKRSDRKEIEDENEKNASLPCLVMFFCPSPDSDVIVALLFLGGERRIVDAKREKLQFAEQEANRYSLQ